MAKRLQIEEKLTWTAYRNTSTPFQTVPFPTPYNLPFPKWGYPGLLFRISATPHCAACGRLPGFIIYLL